MAVDDEDDDDDNDDNNDDDDDDDDDDNNAVCTAMCQVWLQTMTTMVSTMPAHYVTPRAVNSAFQALLRFTLNYLPLLLINRTTDVIVVI